MRGTSCWGICSAAARKRLGSGALSRALHGGGEVAAGGRSVLRGKAGEAQREGKKRWRRSCATRGRQRKQEVAGLALHSGDGAEQRRRGAEQAGRLEEGEKGPV